MNKAVKISVFFLCLIPLGLLIWQGYNDELGANPIEEITHRTGSWTLKFILITLTITPLRQIFGFNKIIRLRRMVGLFAFFYAVLHFLCYFVLDQFFDFSEILKDISKRPYITIGFTSLLMLIPLAVTSTNKMVKRLGKRWKSLHQLIYVVAVFSIFHYLWLVKADILYPVIYGILLIVLLSIRVWFARMKGKR